MKIPKKALFKENKNIFWKQKTLLTKEGVNESQLRKIIFLFQIPLFFQTMTY